MKVGRAVTSRIAAAPRKRPLIFFELGRAALCRGAATKFWSCRICSFRAGIRLFHGRKRHGFFPVHSDAWRFFPSMLGVRCSMFDVSHAIFSARLAIALLTKSPTCATWSMPMNASTSGSSFGSSSRKRCGRQPETMTAWPRLVRVAQFSGFENGVHALLLRGVNERAGVDDDGVGLPRRR